MLSGVTNETDKVLLHLTVKICIERTRYFISTKIADDSGHVLKIEKAPIYGVFDISVISVSLIEIIGAWQAERSVDISGSGVVPNANVATDNFGSHRGNIGVLGGNFELQKYGRKLFERTGNHLSHLGSAVLPMSGGVLGKPVQGAPVDGLQSLNLRLDGRQGSFYARFGIFALRVEVDCLPDGEDGQNDRSDASGKIESISVHMRSGCCESPNAEFSGERSESA